MDLSSSNEGPRIRIKAKLLLPLVAVPDTQPATLLFNNGQKRARVVTLTLSTDYIQLVGRNDRALTENGDAVLTFPYESVKSVEVTKRKYEVAIICKRPDDYFWCLCLKLMAIKRNNRFYRKQKITGKDVQLAIQKNRLEKGLPSKDITGNEGCSCNCHPFNMNVIPRSMSCPPIPLASGSTNQDSRLKPKNELPVVHTQSSVELTHAEEVSQSSQSLVADMESAVSHFSKETSSETPLSQNKDFEEAALETEEESTLAHQVISASETEVTSMGRSESIMDPCMICQDYNDSELFYVVLHRPEAGQKLGIGIMVIKGSDSSCQHRNVYVKGVVKNSVAHRDGLLNRGDKIVSVNGRTLAGVSKPKAKRIFADAGLDVTLLLARKMSGRRTSVIKSVSSMDPVAMETSVGNSEQEDSELKPINELQMVHNSLVELTSVDTVEVPQSSQSLVVPKESDVSLSQETSSETPNGIETASVEKEGSTLVDQVISASETEVTSMDRSESIVDPIHESYESACILTPGSGGGSVSLSQETSSETPLSPSGIDVEIVSLEKEGNTSANQEITVSEAEFTSMGRSESIMDPIHESYESAYTLTPGGQSYESPPSPESKSSQSLVVDRESDVSCSQETSSETTLSPNGIDIDVASLEAEGSTSANQVITVSETEIDSSESIMAPCMICQDYNDSELFFFVLHRPEASQKLGIGIMVIKGSDSSCQHQNVYVKGVVKNSVAHKDGHFKRGDKIVSVNGQTLAGVSKPKAKKIFAEAGLDVTLLLARKMSGRRTSVIKSVSSMDRVAMKTSVDNSEQEDSELTPTNELPTVHNSLVELTSAETVWPQSTQTLVARESSGGSVSLSQENLSESVQKEVSREGRQETKWWSPDEKQACTCNCHSFNISGIPRSRSCPPILLWSNKHVPAHRDGRLDVKPRNELPMVHKKSLVELTSAETVLEVPQSTQSVVARKSDVSLSQETSSETTLSPNGIDIKTASLKTNESTSADQVITASETEVTSMGRSDVDPIHESYESAYTLTPESVETSSETPLSPDDDFEQASLEKEGMIPAHRVEELPHIAQLQDELEERDDQIAKLQKHNKLLMNALKEAKQRNESLSGILSQLVKQVEQLTTVKYELTEQVQSLHSYLEEQEK